MKKLCAFLMVCASAMGFCFAETWKNLKEAEKHCMQIVEDFSDGNFQHAVDMLKTYTIIVPSAMDNLVVQATEQWALITDNYGKKLDVRLLDTDKESDCLVKYTHLVRMEKYPLVFETILYKNDEGWVVINFQFNDTIINLF